MFKTEKYSESFISPRYREIVRQFCGTKEGRGAHYGSKGKKRLSLLTNTVFIIVAIVLINTLPIYAQQETSQQYKSIEEIEHALAYQDSGGVFDFGNYLKQEGIQELQDLCKSFYHDGFTLWILTVPKSTPVNVAERIYGNMNYDENDILIVFKPGRIYGKSLALKGEPEKFKEFAESSRKAFKRYTAYGLKNYSELIKNRIKERNESRIKNKSFLKTTGIVIGIVVVGGIICFIIIVRMLRRSLYREKIGSASAILGEIGLMEIPSDFENKFLEVSNKLEVYGVSKNYRNTKNVENLIKELGKLKTQIEER